MLRDHHRFQSCEQKQGRGRVLNLELVFLSRWFRFTCRAAHSFFDSWQRGGFSDVNYQRCR
jgi:hypothetical protein